MFDEFKHLDDMHEKKKQLFKKLQAEPPRVAEVGERVLICGELVGSGFEWTRHEAVVYAVADTSYRVGYVDRKDIRTGEQTVEWVHMHVVTDVLGH